VFLYDEDSISRKESDFADARNAKSDAFEVPHGNTKPIAKVGRQEHTIVAGNQQLNSIQQEPAGRYQTDHATGLKNADPSTDINQPANVTPGNSGTVSKSSYFQSSFDGFSGSATAFPRASAVSSSASLGGHVGDTPLALAGIASGIK